MFWSILKKDLKRKKTMNVILLLFVIMCSMFAAASVNNIIAVTGGIDKYFDLAEVPDVTVELGESEGAKEAKAKIMAMESVSNIKEENCGYLLSSNVFTYKGKKMDNSINSPILLSDSELGIKYFDDDENVIEDIPKGCFYTTSQFVQDLDVSIGDEFTLNVGDAEVKLRYMGRVRGALFANDSSASAYVLMDSEDFDKIISQPAMDQRRSSILYVTTSNIDEITALESEDVFVTTRESSKDIYMYDMLAAYILLAMCAVLLFTAFVVLRFTINFTINEEFREIGVMKAVGIDNFSIRSLYIVKYLAIAVVGSVIGFIASIPLGSKMMESISKNIIFRGNNSVVMGALCSAGVVVVILLFCYSCTNKVKKLSPIDAVRNGETGERFKKKSILRLGHSKLPATGFLSANDVVSAPKRFALITLIFALCMLLMTMMSIFALTLKSEKILWAFDVPNTQAHIMDLSYMDDTFVGDYQKTLDKTNKMLEDCGIKGESGVLMGTRFDVKHGDKVCSEWLMVNKGLENDLLKADEGSMPQKTDEVAMCGYAMDDLGVKIGDRVTVDMFGEEKEFIVTGRIQMFQGGGHSLQMHKDFDLAMNSSFTTLGVNIRFDGDPDEATINSNIEKIKDAIGTKKVYTTSGVLKMMTGMSDTLNSIKKLMMVVTVILTSMIVVLMERSFISKEKSEIALMKAVGISSGSIIAQHALRFVIVSILACIVSLAGLMPLSNALMGFICSMIGDVHSIKCDFDFKEVFLICPAILIGITVIGSFLTALCTKTIKAADAASIE